MQSRTHVPRYFCLTPDRASHNLGTREQCYGVAENHRRGRFPVLPVEGHRLACRVLVHFTRRHSQAQCGQTQTPLAQPLAQPLAEGELNAHPSAILSGLRAATSIR